MSNEYRVCAYWQQVNIGGFQEYRCVALNPLFTSYNWKVDDISCFNQDSSNPEYGKCNGEGTCWTCTKYSPGGLGFGKFDPETGLYRLPFVYVVYNLRALLSRCCYWDSAKEIFFTINASTGEIIRPPNHCTKGSMAKKWHSPDHPEYDLPCNGCKESCPYYTGVEWEYCTDDKLKRGDFITAKQIQELRYYSDDWNEYDDPYVIFKSRFLDADIFAWDGKFISADDGEVREIAKPGTYNFPVLNKVEINLDDNSSETTQVTPTVASVGTRDAESAPDFPTLIRDLNDSLLLRPKFIFPEKDYIHRHWKPDGNKITVIGYFPVNTEVYVVNDAFVEIPSIIDKLELESKSGKLWSDDALSILNEEVEGLIDKTLWEDSDHIYSAVPKNSGLFYIYNVELKIGKSQNLIVFAKDINDQWVFTKIRVHDYFYHIFVMQTKWESNWWTDKDFNNTGKIEGRFCFMQSQNDLEITFQPNIAIKAFYHHNVREYFNLFTSYSIYFYHRVRVIIDNFEVPCENWDFIDNCGRLLVKIPDLHLNRFYGWDLDFAKLAADGVEVRFNVEYKANNSEVFPPNYVVLKPVSDDKFRRFNKNDCSLYIKYHYFEERPNPISLKKNEILELPGPNSVKQVSSYKVKYDDYQFTVENINTGPIVFRVDVADDTGRIIGVKTIKFAVQYHQVQCRDFEIFYAWAAEYDKKLLHPHGFVAGRERIKFKYIDLGTVVETLTPVCGDHEVGRISGIGPMWFPYVACDNSIKYFPQTRCPNWCFLPVEGTPGVSKSPDHDYRDHRLRGPDEYYTAITGKVHSLGLLNATCWHRYDYCYEKRTSDFYFIGHAAARGNVNVPEYIANGWALPKFGNVLREMSIVNRCVDYIQYFNRELNSGGAKWVPLTEYWTTPDSLFSEDLIHSLEFVLTSNIADESFVEVLDNTNRYRYDQILFCRRSPTIIYPNFNGRYSYFYQYKDSLYGECIQWAYKEIWKSIDRSDDKETRINSIELGYPDYVYDYRKDEIQIVADEGEYDLEFNPPVYDLDGNISSDAYFKLGNGPPRYIDLKTLQWKDESAKQGGNTVTPKYMHYTTEDGWDRSVDLWSENCSEGSKAEARYYELEDDFGDKTKIYYFKGIKLSVNGNRFPYDESDVNEYGSEFIFLSKPSHEVRTIEEDTWIGYSNSRLDSDLNVQDAFEWTKADASVEKHVIIDCSEAVCLREVEIGYFKGKNIWKDSISYSYFPGCSIYASNDNSNYVKIMDIEKSRYSDSVRLSGLVKDSTKKQKSPILSNFMSPYRYYKIVFKIWTEPLACFILNYIKLKKMKLKRITEPIKVYENRFLISKAQAKDFNTHGTQDNPLLEPAMDGSTIYVSEVKVRTIVGDSEYKTISKLRSRVASKRHLDKEEKYSHYADITKLEHRQYELFDLAREKMGNTSVFYYVLPDCYLEFLKSFGMRFPTGTLTMISRAPKLKEIEEVPRIGKLWNASGHRYTWEKTHIYRERCSPSAVGFHFDAWTCDDYSYKHLNHANDSFEEPVHPLWLYYHLFDMMLIEKEWWLSAEEKYSIYEGG